MGVEEPVYWLQILVGQCFVGVSIFLHRAPETVQSIFGPLKRGPISDFLIRTLPALIGVAFIVIGLWRLIENEA